MSGHQSERPLGGPIFTPTFFFLLMVIFSGAVLVLYRMLFGLGAVSAMNDGYAWGIWKPLNVVTFTGIGAGAYAVGLLAYVFNRWHYHSLVRSAIVVGAMAYTLGGTSVLIDLGRWWNLWVTFYPPLYNLNSVLLEVAVCVMAYTGVLWAELTPAILEQASRWKYEPVRRVAAWGLPWVRKALPIIISVALLLPTMHQSSLGGLYMITPTKLHPLWYTPWLSGLFLMSCLTMGFGAVVIVENLTSLNFRRRMDQRLLGRMAPVPAMLVLSFIAIRLIDIAVQGKLGYIWTFDFYSKVFLIEMGLFLVPALMMLRRNVRKNRGALFMSAVLLVLAGTVYRFDTYLVAYLPTTGWVYFPSLGELLLSACLASTGIAVYLVMIKLFPILSGVRPRKKPAAAEHTTTVQA
jgi:Ni/Fe-hydrogenase subunit HybB-like protein